MDSITNNIEPNSCQAKDSITATEILRKLIDSEIIQDLTSELDNFDADQQIKSFANDDNEQVLAIKENENLFEDELIRDAIQQNNDPTLTLVHIGGTDIHCLNPNTLQVYQFSKKKRTNRKPNLTCFPNMLFKIINECQSGAIKWSKNGYCILINIKHFDKEYLKQKNGYFKTNKILSFIRQLNLYGFFKKNKQVDARDDDSKGYDIFMNEYFQRDRPDLLSKITRRITRNEKKENILCPIFEVSPPESVKKMEQMSADKRIDESQQEVPIILQTTNQSTIYIQYSPVILNNITNTFINNQQIS